MPKENLLLLFSITLIFTSCIWITDDEIITEPYQSAYEAVILQREVFENSTELTAPQPIGISGKIYVKDQFLLINEPNKGFHIFDNSNPSNPVKIKFLKVLGSTDISIKGQLLYINNAVDLIAVTYNSDFSNILITKRVRNVFPILISPDGFYPNLSSETEIVVDWILTN
ncbi:MAG: hypothetical protein L3J25_10605 [Flavobacteriaceae bacterium]|nr:hypothetical protein [Flavobacteriaceae bacterium]